MAATIQIEFAMEGIRLSLRGILEDEGYAVAEAASAEEGLSLAEAVQPDLVFLDIWLPGMDGISVLRQLQKQGDAPMTILVSGFVSDRMLAEASELGAAYFLPKPFETAALLDKMRGLFLKAPQES